MVFNAHLPYLAKRTCVPSHISFPPSPSPCSPVWPSIYAFQNYIWEKTSGDFSHFNGNPIPAEIPA
jgi:hypothetical protein